MKELRCIVFSDAEVAAAVTDRRRRISEPFPAGSVGRVDYLVEDTVRTRLSILGEDGATTEIVLEEPEVTAALVSYCMNRKVPLPAGSEKMLYVIRDALTLMITLNFNRAPRLAVETAIRSAVRDRPSLRAVG